VIVECVVNVSEGRDEDVLRELAAPVGSLLLDLHRDPSHHRSVFTLAGPAADVELAVRALATVAVERLDLRTHQGVHPRLGVLDVVPFVPYRPGEPPSHDLTSVLPLRDDFARWMSATFGVPSFLYGPLPGGLLRTLPQVRRHAFSSIPPEFGPGQPHPTAGATAVGARTALVAYNVWVSSPAVAHHVVPLVRGPLVRTLAFQVGDRAQVSCNLIEPAAYGPASLYDTVTGLVEAAGGTVIGAELVGLVPQAVLEQIPAGRWAEIGLSAETTVEARLEAGRPIGGGSAR
jgi:glutamate formiminotransferase / 5-formyltetrahydrofolate cyclo-ligase